PVAEAAVEAADRRLEAAQRRDALVVALAEADEEHRAATDAAQVARDAFQEIRQARLEGMAARLAHELRPGQPCRGCRPPQHRVPAADGGGTPDDDAESAAEAAYERVRERRGDIAERLAELRTEQSAAAKDAGDEDVDDLRTALAAVQDELTALTAAETDAER